MTTPILIQIDRHVIDASKLTHVELGGPAAKLVRVHFVGGTVLPLAVPEWDQLRSALNRLAEAKHLVCRHA